MALARALPATLAVSVLLAPPAPSRALTVWTAPASVKVRPTAPTGGETAGALQAARNEFEAFQLFVAGPASGVTATASELVGPARIGGVKLYREAIYTARYASAADGGTGRWPDALVPDVDDVVGEKRNAFPFDVPAGENRGIWVEVYVPASAPPGEYAGTVTVRSSAGDTAVPVTLTVWPFALPSTASLRSAFGLAYGALEAGFGVAGDAAAATAVRQRTMQLALDHRFSIWSADDGDLALSHVDSAYGPFLDGTAPTTLPGAKLTSFAYLGGPGGFASWAAHFRAKGWFDRLYDHLCDEPPRTCAWSDIPARAAMARAADPGFKTLVTTDIAAATANGVLSSITALVPLINFLDDKPGHPLAGPQIAKYAGFVATPGHEVWTYQSCMSHGCGGTVDIGNPSESDLYYTGWPSYVIDAGAVRARALEWLSFQYGLDGELYYETAMSYTHDPWQDEWDFTGNGDGTLFVPGTVAAIGGATPIPVATLRAKMVREGMEDYEYLKRLADDGDRDLAMQLAASLFPSAYTTEPKVEDLMAARARIAARIVELEGGGSGAGSAGSASQAGTGIASGGLGGGAKAIASGGGCSSGGAGVLALLGLGVLFARRRC